MSSILKNSIEYTGISDSLPEFEEKIAPIKQFDVSEILEIPSTKPDIERILRVEVNLVIESVKIIKTPVAMSIDEQNLTGWKAVVVGELRQIIQYVADKPTQSVHAAHFNYPISTYIVLPPDFSEDKSVTVNGYIEDIYAMYLKDYYMENGVAIKRARKIFKNTTILLVAEIED